MTGILRRLLLIAVLAIILGPPLYFMLVEQLRYFTREYPRGLRDDVLNAFPELRRLGSAQDPSASSQTRESAPAPGRPQPRS